MCFINASGTYIPPLFIFIFACKRMKSELKKNGPPSAIYCCPDNYWINEIKFLEWHHHFYDVVKPSKEDPVLLIVGNHSRHCTLEGYNFCKERGIVVLTILPHTSHRLQPPDVAFYSSLKSAYNIEYANYLRSHPHERITTSKIAEIFKNAYGRVATPIKVIKGFEDTGIFPCKPENFTDEDCSRWIIYTRTVWKKQNQEKEVIELDEEKNNKEVTENPENTTPDKKHDLSFVDIIPIQGCSKDNSVGYKMSNHNSSRKQHSEIMTSTPMKSILEEKQRKKEEQIRLKVDKGTKRKISVKKSTPLKPSPTPRIIPKGTWWSQKILHLKKKMIATSTLTRIFVKFVASSVRIKSCGSSVVFVVFGHIKTVPVLREKYVSAIFVSKMGVRRSSAPKTNNTNNNVFYKNKKIFTIWGIKHMCICHFIDGKKKMSQLFFCTMKVKCFSSNLHIKRPP